MAECQSIYKLDLDHLKMRAWLRRHCPSLEETGQFMTDLCEWCLLGDVEYVSSLPFVKKIYLERDDLPSGRIHIPNYLRQDVLSAGSCARCGSFDDLSVDHIVPVSKGGSNKKSNLQCLCLPCNIRKGAKEDV